MGETRRLDLDAIEGRERAATPGPWFPWRAVGHGMTVQRAAGFVAVMSSHGTEVDAVFLAHAREDIPALCSRVRALESALREAIDGIDDLDPVSGEECQKTNALVVRLRGVLGGET